MSMIDRLLHHLLASTVQALVRKSLDEEKADLLYRFRVHGDSSRLHIDSTAIVNNALFNLSSGEITVGKHAFFGHNVSLLTGTHDVHKFGRDRQTAIPKSGRDIVVGEGAWLASDVLVLGPSLIGDHAVVAAGSLVVGNVDAYTIVAGRPAKTRHQIEP